MRGGLLSAQMAMSGSVLPEESNRGGLASTAHDILAGHAALIEACW